MVTKGKCIQWRAIQLIGHGANDAPHHHWHQWLLSLAPMAIAIGAFQVVTMAPFYGDVTVRIAIKRKGRQLRRWHQ